MGQLNQLADRFNFRVKGLFTDFTNDLLRVGISYKDVKLTSTQMDTLNATPVELVAAPGTGKFLEVIAVLAFNDFGTAAFELGSGTVDIRYTDSSGGLAAQLTNAFVESAADALFKAYGRDVVISTNAALVAYASADVTAGDGSLYLRVFYRTQVTSEISPTVA
jgi:hypothetical protein